MLFKLIFSSEIRERDHRITREANYRQNNKEFTAKPVTS